MRAYSQDLRKRVIAGREKGQSGAVVARRLSLSVRTVERYWRRYQESGQTSSQRQGGHMRSRLAEHDATLDKWIEREPDLTLEELCQRCQKQLHISISVPALWHRLKRIGLSFKKNDARRRARPS